eukprot:gnl/MRDRNA2_/MRDRNA2_82820_c0_seq1.p1 gnl/MRDRNA2_/MRDRNA2_82820_c0~~gnl/MRDRNA2_/MRDRNA2_82820_c0_seq1.p1  ORF type:complete len:508 (+),score=47.10 gnl/MRDRNA2_/MRDRNA2_82820_c0_seq1:74-1525(+)
MSAQGSSEKLRWSSSNLVHLVLLPYLSGQRVTFYFAALPLHYLENGWSLTIFGLTVATSTLIRSFITNPVYGKLGPWFVVPIGLWQLCLAIPQLIYPDSFVAVTIGIFGFSWMHFLDPYQSLNFCRFEDEHQRTQASRLVTLADTLGFAFSPFISGILYDLGGWILVAIGLVVIIICELVLQASSRQLRADFQRWRDERKEAAIVAVKGGASETEATNGTPTKEIPVKGLPRQLLLPAILITMGTFLNIFLYVTEWAVFAAYFRQEFNWQSAWWAGAAQMSGDITGAMILIASNKLKGKQQACQQIPLCRPPYHISVLLFSWALCHFFLASDIFAVAVAAQVVMGTVFVFTSQFLVEMIHLYAGTDFKLFLKVQVMCGTAFGMGIACATFLATWLYTTFGRKVPFQVAAVVALVGFVLYTTGFLVRVGIPKSLKEYEEKYYSQRLSTISMAQVHHHQVHPGTEDECKNNYSGGSSYPEGAQGA